MRKNIFTFCMFFSCSILANDSQSQFNYQNKDHLSQKNRGGIGLLQIPTARMASEGSFFVNYHDINEYRFWSASIQLFPWMESTVRYSDVRTRLYSPFPGFSGDQTYKDKGIDVKFRLLKEGYYLPDLSVGFLDIGGTGLFASEYITASKAIGNLDFHLGFSTGYLGASGNITNPFCELRESFCDRPSGFSGLGGKVEFGEFFKGTAAVFVGLEYRTSLPNLILKLEYDGNDYSRDFAGVLEQDSPWNIGAVYHHNDLSFNISYQRGNTFGFGVSYYLNFHTFEQVNYDPPPRSLANVSPAKFMTEIDIDDINQQLRKSGGFTVNDSDQPNDTEITFYGRQRVYRDNDEAIERIGRVLASQLPQSINTYRIVETNSNVPMVETIIDAKKLKTAARHEVLEADINESFIRQQPSKETIDNYDPKSPSGTYFGLQTFWSQMFGNPEEFYFYQGGVFANTGYSFSPKLSFRTAFKVTLLDNFDKFNFFTDSQPSTLPRVRTHVREYITRNDITLENTYVHWKDQLSNNWFGQLYAGYIETMFAGTGGEIMYRPVDSKFAFGLDLNYVKQRDFDSETALFDYSVLTGHASIYWQPEFLPDMQLTFNVGQFLAKDRGVNVNLTKRFDSGIEVGVYAAFTNVSAEEYGEGSFSKGFYITIPTELFSLKSKKGSGKIPWTPINRDGGQMLLRPVILSNFTESRSLFSAH